MHLWFRYREKAKELNTYYHQCRQQCAKRRSESVKLPIFQKNEIEYRDEVREEESTIRESTEEFSIENIEARQDSETAQSL